MAMPAFFALLSHKITSSIPVMLLLHKPLVIEVDKTYYSNFMILK